MVFFVERSFNAIPSAVAVLAVEPVALVPPGLPNFYLPDVAIQVYFQHTMGIAKLCGSDNAGQFNVAAGGPCPAVMGQRNTAIEKQEYCC